MHCYVVVVGRKWNAYSSNNDLVLRDGVYYRSVKRRLKKASTYGVCNI